MRRLLALGMVAVVAWTMFFVSREWDLAANVTGSSTGSCIRADFVAYEGSVVGIAHFKSQFRLDIEGTALVSWRWELSNGASTASKHYRGPGTWFKTLTTPTGGIEPVYMQPGSTGTIRLKFYFLLNDAYDGCYRINSVVIQTTPFVGETGGGGSGGGTSPAPSGGGIATPSPTPTPDPEDPTPTPAPTSPACSLEPGFDESECPPPDGYCYGYGPPNPGASGWPIVECETPEPTPTPTPGATAPADISSGVICSWSSPWDSGCSGSVSVASLDGGGIEPGDIVTVVIYDNVVANAVDWSRHARLELPSHGAYPGWKVCDSNDGTGGAVPGAAYPGGVGTHETACDEVTTAHTGPARSTVVVWCTGNAQHPANGNCTADIWVQKAGVPTPTPTVAPSADPTPTPTPPPGWMTPQPGQPGSGNGFEGSASEVEGSGNEPLYPAPSGTGSGGSGVAECMADGMTAVEDKVGYIAPVTVPVGPDLQFMINAQGAMPPPMNIFLGAITWVGVNVTVAQKQAEQIPVHMWNRGVDAVIPGQCVGEIVETRVNELLTIEPFATYVEVDTELRAALAEGAPVMPEFCVPLPGGGEACLPLGEWASVIGPYRNAAAVLVWLLAALAVRGVIIHSFAVAKANVRMDEAAAGPFRD